MKDIKNMSTEELEQERKNIMFLQTALDSHQEKLISQHEKELSTIIKNYNALFDIKMAINKELNSRTTDKKLNKTQSPMAEIMEASCDRVVLDKNFFKSE